ncbi:MAG: hypothetical protein A2X12_03320 [Bacteroidetes bacterium GWE2_29_8]|nr:MAG: hypothetical protein A2X12_03320 [Bacteroidetes bacterium GWE2_29_8]OFY14132.1 MAG: hypothetical protein A2X02_02555 [Bacteroidetes bacterium GWF2_29_10]
MIKIAIPCSCNNTIEEYFEKGQQYLLITIINNIIVNKELIKITGGCAFKTNVLEILNNHKIKLLLVNSISEKINCLLNYYGIAIIKNCKGDINNLIDLYLSGDLELLNKKELEQQIN